MDTQVSSVFSASDLCYVLVGPPYRFCQAGARLRGLCRAHPAHRNIRTSWGIQICQRSVANLSTVIQAVSLNALLCQACSLLIKVNHCTATLRSCAVAMTKTLVTHCRLVITGDEVTPRHELCICTFQRVQSPRNKHSARHNSKHRPAHTFVAPKLPG